MKKAVFCTVGASDIQPAVGALRSAGISIAEISILAPHAEGMKNTDLAPDALHGVEAGAIVGGALGEIVTLGSLVIEGLGAFLVGGPITMLFAGAVGGGLIGGLTAATGDLPRLVGIPRSVAHRVEKQLDAGRGLLFVHYRSEEHKNKAIEVFRQFDASDIETTSEMGQGATQQP